MSDRKTHRVDDACFDVFFLLIGIKHRRAKWGAIVGSSTRTWTLCLQPRQVQASKQLIDQKKQCSVGKALRKMNKVDKETKLICRCIFKNVKKKVLFQLGAGRWARRDNGESPPTSIIVLTFIHLSRRT